MTSELTPGSGRNLRPALIASLALNVLIVGGVAAALLLLHLHGGRGHYKPPGLARFPRPPPPRRGGRAPRPGAPRASRRRCPPIAASSCARKCRPRRRISRRSTRRSASRGRPR